MIYHITRENSRPEKKREINQSRWLFMVIFILHPAKHIFCIKNKLKVYIPITYFLKL